MDDNDNLDDNQHDGEMVGLHNPANVRSCVAHKCCGGHLVVGDLVRFKREIMRIEYAGPGAAEPNFRYETVLKMVVIQDGVESCHVGFLTKACGCQVARGESSPWEICPSVGAL